MNVLLDMDILVYKVSAALEQRVRWDDDVMTTHFNLHDGVSLIQKMTKDVISTVSPKGETIGKVALCFSGKSEDNYRKAVIDPDYKSNRSKTVRPLGLGALRESCMYNGCLSDLGQVCIATHAEADDLLGCLRTSIDDIMVSDDKDLNTVPGYHTKFPTQGQHELYYVDSEQANRFLLTQWLTGDATDGIKGCPKVGPAGASKILDGLTIEEGYEAVIEKFQKAGIPEDRMWQDFKLLYINRRDHREWMKSPWELLTAGDLCSF